MGILFTEFFHIVTLQAASSISVQQVEKSFHFALTLIIEPKVTFFFL